MVRTQISAESESPEADRCSASGRELCAPDPLGPGMARQKPGAYCAVLTAVLRAIRSPWRPIVRLLSRVECPPSDLLTCVHVSPESRRLSLRHL